MLVIARSSNYANLGTLLVAAFVSSVDLLIAFSSCCCRMKSVEKDKDELTVNQDKALRDLRRKTDTTIEGMKKEQANAAAKVIHTCVVLVEVHPLSCLIRAMSSMYSIEW